MTTKAHGVTHKQITVKTEREESVRSWPFCHAEPSADFKPQSGSASAVSLSVTVPAVDRRVGLVAHMFLVPVTSGSVAEHFAENGVTGTGKRLLQRVFGLWTMLQPVSEAQVGPVRQLEAEVDSGLQDPQLIEQWPRSRQERGPADVSPG